MKKILFVLAALMFAGPALARVDITCTHEGDGVVAIYYDAVTEGNSVRAFALDIRADAANITDVNDEVNADFWVFPGTIQISDGVVTAVGTAEAPGGDAGSCTDDSNCSTIEMATLYVGANEPPDQALLLKITVDGDTCITITENSTRGEVVSESIVDEPGYDVDVNAPVFCVQVCACLGDICDSTTTLGPDGTVNIGDLSKLLTELLTVWPTGDPTGYFDIGLPAGLECIDLCDSTTILPPDGTIDIGDLSKLLTEILTVWPTGDPTGYFDIGCPL